MEFDWIYVDRVLSTLFSTCTIRIDGSRFSGFQANGRAYGRLLDSLTVFQQVVLHFLPRPALTITAKSPVSKNVLGVKTGM
jgi:hypothetical protein